MIFNGSIISFKILSLILSKLINSNKGSSFLATFRYSTVGFLIISVKSVELDSLAENNNIRFESSENLSLSR